MIRAASMPSVHQLTRIAVPGALFAILGVLLVILLIAMLNQR